MEAVDGEKSKLGGSPKRESQGWHIYIKGVTDVWVLTFWNLETLIQQPPCSTTEYNHEDGADFKLASADKGHKKDENTDDKLVEIGVIVTEVLGGHEYQSSSGQ